MNGKRQRPGKIVCVGRNYVGHAKEFGNDVPKEPLLFLKPPSSVIWDGDAIVRPPQSKQIDFEGEIGVVIGTTLSWGDEAASLQAIRGVCALNDVTARDIQKTDSQFTRGKGFDTFCALGPEVPVQDDIKNVIVVTRVNGEERQRGSASEMVFSIPFVVSYISSVMTLEPGDVVATGTPEGVGPMADGDVVEVELLGLSRVRNPVTSRA
jgi:2-keto-4-pentenoate hydratase/2-oxohepta-3-ene-1,7-dioic acid hydratase in catechol pathway